MRIIVFLFLVTTLIHAYVLDRENNNEEMTINQDGETVEPEQIPRLNSRQKHAYIRLSGQDPLSRRRRNKIRVRRLQRRDLLLTPWRITHVLPKKPLVPRPMEPPMAMRIDSCPKKFDAVTKAFNGRTYAFAENKVYQMWYENNLPQKASFDITELFPGGPRQVSAALTNSRSGVTTLFDRRKAYRYRWNKKANRFHMAKNRTPQELPSNITVNPTLAFEWFDGNQVIVENREFAIYDAYWNLATFGGELKRYFPNLPRDLIGIVYNGGDTALFYTRSNKLKVYHAKKYRVMQEYPIKIGEFVGCL